MHAWLGPLLILTALAAALPATGQVTTVASVDLDRYVGTWFEVARFENRFQKNCVSDVRAIYTRRDDGRIDVVNQCRQQLSRTPVLPDDRLAAAIARVRANGFDEKLLRPTPPAR